MEFSSIPDPETNPLLDSDSYKYSHHLQDPALCTSKTYYIEARTGGDYDYCAWYGFHSVLSRHFKVQLTHEHVVQAAEILVPHGLPFPSSQWHAIVDEYKGRFPIKIDAVREGTVLKTGNLLAKIKSTDPKYPWVGGFLETPLLRVWYPTTVCTRSHEIKQIFRAALERSSDNPEAELPFKLHDFGGRGTTTREAAAIGGAAHLVNFKGTDTVAALVEVIHRYMYRDMPGFSIPASEHGTVLSWGPQGEYSHFDNMLNQFAIGGKIVAAVSDTYDLWHAIDVLWGERLKDKVIKSGATIVIRPDSGIPHVVVLECFRRLDAKFGSTINKKGYRVLNNVRVIQGDGNDRQSIPVTINTFMDAWYSMTNVAFGMGAGLLQKLDRDTLRFAMKVCEVEVNGQIMGVRKCPIDAPEKASKAGDLDLVWTDRYLTIDRRKQVEYRDLRSELETVYTPETGLCLPTPFDTIRLRSEMPIR